MAPPHLFDFSQIDLDQVVADVDDIERVNPHRGHMRMLDGVIWHDEGFTRSVAYKDVEHDAFWVAGHIPGRPIFPGVLMIEAAAQLASYLTMRRLPEIQFMGFVACDDVKFRGQVVPGDRLILVGIGVDFRRRRSVCAVQGFVHGNLVFEASITGMPI